MPACMHTHAHARTRARTFGYFYLVLDIMSSEKEQRSSLTHVFSRVLLEYSASQAKGESHCVRYYEVSTEKSARARVQLLEIVFRYYMSSNMCIHYRARV